MKTLTCFVICHKEKLMGSVIHTDGKSRSCHVDSLPPLVEQTLNYETILRTSPFQMLCMIHAFNKRWGSSEAEPRAKCLDVIWL